jgi:hypothetical protein
MWGTNNAAASRARRSVEDLAPARLIAFVIALAIVLLGGHL